MVEKQTQSAIRKIADFKKDLQALGADQFDLMLPETYALLGIIQANENISGVVYKKYVLNNSEHSSGRGLLVATDRRIILVNKKPMFQKNDELSYSVVSGVNYSKAGIAGTVTVHSRTGDMSIRTYNSECANTFVKAIEEQCFNKPNLQSNL
jgi:hypothetical protein